MFLGIENLNKKITNIIEDVNIVSLEETKFEITLKYKNITRNYVVLIVV